MTLFFVLNSPEAPDPGDHYRRRQPEPERRHDGRRSRSSKSTNRTEIPVYPRRRQRLSSMRGREWDTKRHGGWYANEPPPAPPGGFAKKKTESMSAIDFLVNTVMQNPGSGHHPGARPADQPRDGHAHGAATFAGNVKQLVIMGGAIASLPDGGGNHTPNAEFNFYVDPEAAQIVLRSGIPIVLSPLNISRKSRFNKEWYDKIVAVDTPITRLIKERLGPGFEKNPTRSGLMYDQIAAATLDRSDAS